MISECINCKKIKSVAGDGMAKGLCKVCYKKLLWKPKSIICKRCNRELPMHAKGLCTGCYISVFHIDKIKVFNTRRLHKIDYDKYRALTRACVVCRFDKIVQLHHLDHNRKNNSEKNLVGLCPNHHSMLHNRKFEVEMHELLKEKGFDPLKPYDSDETFKKD